MSRCYLGTDSKLTTCFFQLTQYHLRILMRPKPNYIITGVRLSLDHDVVELKKGCNDIGDQYFFIQGAGGSNQIQVRQSVTSVQQSRTITSYISN